MHCTCRLHVLPMLCQRFIHDLAKQASIYYNTPIHALARAKKVVSSC